MAKLRSMSILRYVRARDVRWGVERLGSKLGDSLSDDDAKQERSHIVRATRRKAGATHAHGDTAAAAGTMTP
jgi:hypothetical protein